MKITNYVPSDWKNLEKRVCELLNEAGYLSENSKKINTVRGTVEVDIFSTSDDELIKQFICECKFWSRPVPKEKIHAFRTVVNDSGSTLGIFISKMGYQSGAYEAAYCSNILLKDWNGFIKLIEKKWLKLQLIEIKKMAHMLSFYTDPYDVPFKELSDSQKTEYYNLNTKYIGLFLICRYTYSNILDKEYMIVNDIMFTAIDELFEYLKNNLNIAIKKYKKLFKNFTIEKNKFYDWKHMLIEVPLDNVFDKNIT